MTSRLVYEAVLIEMNKVLAPSLLLEDFNYFFNKAINLYINKRYNIYDINQQTSDDLRVLKSTAILKPKISSIYDSDSGSVTAINSLYGATYDVNLPKDYLHLLNCICNFKVKKQIKCYDKDTYVLFAAIRLTSDLWSQIINNFYMRPSYKRPYYYIHNVNTNSDVPTNSYDPTNGNGTDAYKDDSEYKGLPDIIVLNNSDELDLVEKDPIHRYGNASNVRLEIRYGKDNSIFELDSVYVDYIKTPLFIRLTQEQIDLVEDTSQIMEFPDYVCQEIINELVHIIMENASDPRLQTHMPISMSIANPAQQLETKK